MCKPPEQPPSETRWDIVITNGVHGTVDGPIGGWGWICRSHPDPEGFHGYVDQSAMLIGLSEHLDGCPGRG